MKILIYIGIVIPSAYAGIIIQPAIEQAVRRCCETESNDPLLLIGYQSLKKLESLENAAKLQENYVTAVIQRLDRVTDQLAKMQTAYTQQCNKVTPAWYQEVLDACKSIGTDIRNMSWVRAVRQSRPLQVGLAGVLTIVSINVQLYRWRSAYYGAWDEHEKEHYKRLYQSLARKLLNSVALEKTITVPLRDATIGFWGNGPLAHAIFGCIHEWCSIRSLFYIDLQLLE